MGATFFVHPEPTYFLSLHTILTQERVYAAEK